MKTDQIMYPNHSLQSINRAHFCMLSKPFHNNKYDYALGIMALCFSPVINPKWWTYASAVLNAAGKKLLKDGYCIFMPDGWHLSNSAKTLRYDDGMEGPTGSPLRHHVLRLNCKALFPEKAINLSKIANIFTDFMKLKAAFTNPM